MADAAVEMKALLGIMARLRDPEGGCPWDLEQDFASISPHTIEEAYEVDEAIASGDPESLRDELGDLLFQVVFQARIAEEKGLFDFGGVVEAISSKLVRRHPHVFAEAETPASLDAQVESWESIKARERADAEGGRKGPSDPFVGIPRHLPALARSAKIAGRLARLDPATLADAAESLPPAALEAALARLEEAVAAARGADATPALVGRGLRAWVWLARLLAIDPEQALRLADDATIASVEKALAAVGPGPSASAASRDDDAADGHQAGKSGGR